MPSDLGPWDPMTPDEVEKLLGSAPCMWWIAGGWAIDLHIGRQTRDHDDIDVLILRDDQLLVQEALNGWELHAADPPGTLRRWQKGEVLPPAVHDIWCRRTPTSPWSIQLMIDNAIDGTWTYRRDARVQRPLDALDGAASTTGRRVLAPEIQLLAKSKSPRAKDEADFLAVRDRLSDVQKEWLAQSLTLVSPTHHWLVRL